MLRHRTKHDFLKGEQRQAKKGRKYNETCQRESVSYVEELKAVLILQLNLSDS
jgi:hypothetical protein